jgi:hypothetical protein
MRLLAEPTTRLVQSHHFCKVHRIIDKRKYCDFPPQLHAEIDQWMDIWGRIIFNVRDLLVVYPSQPRCYQQEDLVASDGMMTKLNQRMFRIFDMASA